MQKSSYDVTINGKTYVVESDHPLTDNEAFDYARSQAESEPKTPDAPTSGGFLRNLGDGAINAAAGVPKLLMRAVTQSPAKTAEELAGGVIQRGADYAKDMHPLDAWQSLKSGHPIQALGQALPTAEIYRDPAAAGLDMLGAKAGYDLVKGAVGLPGRISRGSATRAARRSLEPPEVPPSTPYDYNWPPVWKEGTVVDEAGSGGGPAAPAGPKPKALGGGEGIVRQGPEEPPSSGPAAPPSLEAQMVPNNDVRVEPHPAGGFRATHVENGMDVAHGFGGTEEDARASLNDLLADNRRRYDDPTPGDESSYGQPELDNSKPAEGPWDPEPPAPNMSRRDFGANLAGKFKGVNDALHAPQQLGGFDVDSIVQDEPGYTEFIDSRGYQRTFDKTSNSVVGRHGDTFGSHRDEYNTPDEAPVKQDTVPNPTGDPQFVAPGDEATYNEGRQPEPQSSDDAAFDELRAKMGGRQSYEPVPFNEGVPTDSPAMDILPNIHAGRFNTDRVYPEKDWIPTQHTVRSNQVNDLGSNVESWADQPINIEDVMNDSSEPPVIDRSGDKTFIVDGHHRASAALKAGKPMNAITLGEGRGRRAYGAEPDPETGEIATNDPWHSDATVDTPEGRSAQGLHKYEAEMDGGYRRRLADDKGSISTDLLGGAVADMLIRKLTGGLPPKLVRNTIRGTANLVPKVMGSAPVHGMENAAVIARFLQPSQDAEDRQK